MTTIADPSVSEPDRRGRRFAKVRAAAALLHLVLAALIATAVFVQVYLIGAYIFGAGDGALEAHTSVGWATHTAEMLLLLAALAAWLPRTDLLLSVVLVAVGTVQVTLAGSVEWIGALHPLLALVVLVNAAVLVNRGMRRRGTEGARRGASSRS